MSDEPFSLDQLYQAVEQHLTKHLPGVRAVTVWPNISDRVALPAVFLELAEIEPGQDIGTGETTLVCKFEARIIVDPIKPHHQRQAVQLATQLAVLLRAQTWGLPVDPAEFVQAQQDWTQPALDGYTVWLVEWTQQVYLGPEEWPWPDQPPGTLLFGFNNDDKEDFVPAEDA
ncbi:hypothetical protein [Pseudomonas sp. 10S4]|uniref:hypothetical protein n=1 Tax=Pseudomonas sp. 10S4 TaxID=3048583 RepID=UPI002AC97D3E|nr:MULTISPECIES: hypothetical protein [unclassified Pseudomonas]MEB0223585.1 hypothetical protein [Pseudomonas sp. 5S1]MEB0295722.1 hypothetical protein [Pseudomonas sp. 10S4]WPX21029.1 hypothetical protein RHM58_14895 [Pseudomonas sp. 10S4]